MAALLRGGCLASGSAECHFRGAGSRTPGRGAERDAEQDHRAARELQRPERVAERQRARGGADQRLEVEERPRELGRDPRLPVGEQRERQQRARDRQRDQRDDRRRPTRAPAACPRAPRSAPPRARPRPSARRSPRSGRGRAAATAGRPRTSPTAPPTAARARRRRARRRRRRRRPRSPRPRARARSRATASRPGSSRGRVTAAISATSAGTAPTISAAWLTLVRSMPAFWSTITRP